MIKDYREEGMKRMKEAYRSEETVVRLKKLVKAQGKLIKAMEDYFYSMPFCADEVVPDYQKMVDKIAALKKASQKKAKDDA